MNDDRLSKAETRARAWRSAALAAYRHTPVGRLACTQGFVVTHAQAHAAGLASSDIRRLVRRGDWTAPRRGVLSVLRRPDGGDLIHGLRPEIIAAAVALVRTDAVISHECAALAHGTDVLRTPPIATLSTSFRVHACARSGAIVRAAKFHGDDTCLWFGVPITSGARTVIDIARRGARDGIVVADSALREQVVTIEELRAAITLQSRWDGVVTARRVLELASPLSESALESLARLFLADNDVPLPEQQAWIRTHRGWYRVDGLWAQQRVILEVDGLEKYAAGSNALVEEKLRQEALERAGYVVIRVTWADIHANPSATLIRIWAALRRGGLVLQPRATKIGA